VAELLAKNETKFKNLNSWGFSSRIFKSPEDSQLKLKRKEN